MSMNFSFNSHDKSTQNNNIIINNNDNNEIDKILECLKEIKIPESDVNILKELIIKDLDSSKDQKTIGNSVKTWCISIFDKITSEIIVGVSLPLVKATISKVLSSIYHFPVQF